MITLTLSPAKTGATGIFGTLGLPNGVILHSLEHAYPDGYGHYDAKLPSGTYECKLGTHQLHHGGPFQTYEVTGVPGHTGILFHKGNTQSDSEGCILLGMERSGDAVIRSAEAFETFMEALRGVDSFWLAVL